MALTLSGIPSDKFLFVGFLPTKKSSRSDYLIEISNINASIIIFESAKRINGTLMALKEILGNRKVAICRELTKKFEEIINGNISDVLKELSSRDSLKGEIVIVVSGPDASNEKDNDIELMLMDALSTMSASEASKEVSKFTNLSRKEVYNVALKLKGKNYDDS
jgi:16S rRNA (cytidine1402-2'-O)-methyltransferase